MDAIPLSSLSQYGYCPRRAGLLLLEQAWAENEYTASGRAQHERVHDAGIERRGDLLLLYDYAIGSEVLGLNGKCDCVEARVSAQGMPLPFAQGLYALYPIEYKHGVVRDEREYQLQLCAQAMCLEEMYKATIPCGALYFTDAHRRDEVPFTPALRAQVIESARALQTMLESLRVPPPAYAAKCKKCSMLELCEPKLPRGADAYVRRMAQAMEEDV